MEIIVIVGIITIAALLLMRSNKIIHSKRSFKDKVKKAFPKYKIVEKNEQIMICEINHRNEPDELVFIRIGTKKEIRKSGRMIIATYSKEPTINEMKHDFGQHL